MSSILSRPQCVKGDKILSADGQTKQEGSTSAELLFTIRKCTTKILSLHLANRDPVAIVVLLCPCNNLVAKSCKSIIH